MMRLTILIALLFTCAFGKAQVNLVRNPSFEQYTQCSSGPDQISHANYWSGIDSFGNDNCTPEFAHKCDSGISAVPIGFGYYQYPRTGDGMAYVYMFYDEVNSSFLYKRDYLQGRFYTPLTDGQSYCITFYVCMTEIAHYAINRIGAFVNSGIADTSDSCGMPHMQYIPQAQATNVIDDTLNWTKIEGTFTSDGTERFITIGNFYDQANTTYIPFDVGNALHVSYYLVDDVSVIPSDLPAYAGPDVWVALGDSIFIGRPPEVGLECKWYVAGNVVDSGGGIWVHPTVTTTYVVEQTLCGLVKTDTVTVSVFPVGVNGMTNSRQLSVYPNPASTEVTVYMERTVFSQCTIVNNVGQFVSSHALSEKETRIDIGGLPGGVYYLQLSGDGGREVRSFVKM